MCKAKLCLLFFYTTLSLLKQNSSKLRLFIMFEREIKPDGIKPSFTMKQPGTERDAIIRALKSLH